MHIPRPEPQIRIPRSTSPAGDLSAHFCGDVGIVDRLGAMAADVDHLLAEAHEQLDQFPSHFHTSMVTPDRNPHLFAFC